MQAGGGPEPDPLAVIGLLQAVEPAVDGETPAVDGETPGVDGDAPTLEPRDLPGDRGELGFDAIEPVFDAIEPAFDHGEAIGDRPVQIEHGGHDLAGARFGVHGGSVAYGDCRRLSSALPDDLGNGARNSVPDPHTMEALDAGIGARFGDAHLARCVKRAPHSKSVAATRSTSPFPRVLAD